MRSIDTLAHEYGWTDDYILNLTVAKARAFLDAASARRKAEFRRVVALQEWSTKVIAITTAAAAGDKGGKMQKDIAKMTFPWEDETSQKPMETLTEGDDLSFLEAGDMSAADKNAGKTLPTAL